ncbi:hypothetical protein GCM10027062_08350 [Nocardioides hungaricus]
MRRRWIGYVAAWLVAAAAAVTAGVLAVTSVGASVRDRGPLGNEVQRVESIGGSAKPLPGAARATRTIEDDFGTFEVECRGAVAYGLATRANPGWRTVSYEPGPDDDVGAVFARAGGSIEVDVYCNQGRPTVSDIERKTLSDDD